MSGPGPNKRPVNFYFTHAEVKVLDAEAKSRGSNKTKVIRSLIAGLAATRAALGMRAFGVDKATDTEVVVASRGKRKANTKVKAKAKTKTRAKKVVKQRRKRRTKAEMEAARALEANSAAMNPAPVELAIVAPLTTPVLDALPAPGAGGAPAVGPEGPSDIQLVVAPE